MWIFNKIKQLFTIKKKTINLKEIETVHDPSNIVNVNTCTENSSTPINENDYPPSSFVGLMDSTIEVLNNNIVMNELKIWELRDSTLGYEIILSIISINKNDPSDDLIDLISKELNKSRKSIIGALIYLVNHAKFSKSTYDEIKNISKEIGYEEVINIIYNWVKSL